MLTPTYLIFTADGDPDKILAASGIYLFGFTYLYVGIGLLAGLDTTGVGYFSLFVAIAALGYSYVNFRSSRTRPSASSGSTGHSCGSCSSCCSA